MVRKSANPWLRGLLRAGKQQQRTASRALKVLLQAPKPPVAAKPKPKPRPKPVARAVPASAPPPAATASGKWLASHFSARADRGAGAVRRMSYWLYIPDKVPSAAGLPLVVMLHGCDQSATLFAQGTRMNQWAEKKGYAVLYPQQSASVHPHRCWKWYDRATQQGGGDVCVIAGLVGKVAASYPIDRTRMYICGISAGAGMANIVALHHPELFAAIGLHSGPMFGAGHSTVGALSVMRHGASHRVDSAIEEVLQQQPGFPALPTMLIHGEGDTVVRPVNQSHLARQAMLLNRLPHGGGADVLTRAGTKRMNAHRIHDVVSGRKVMLRVAQIENLEHAWSGGDARLSYNSATGPDASKMLLDFFARHRR